MTLLLLNIYYKPNSEFIRCVVVLTATGSISQPINLRLLIEQEEKSQKTVIDFIVIMIISAIIYTVSTAIIYNF